MSHTVYFATRLKSAKLARRTTRWHNSHAKGAVSLTNRAFLEISYSPETVLQWRRVLHGTQLASENLEGLWGQVSR
jgi:hypothetical protein